jgi:hypothetical protein
MGSLSLLTMRDQRNRLAEMIGGTGPLMASPRRR